MPHCSKISKNVSKKSEFTLRKLEKIVKIEQVLHKRHLTIFSFINDYRLNDRFYGHLVHCEKLIACFFYCFVQPKTIIWNRFWPRWHFMQIWLHHFRCHQKLSLVIFGQTFCLYFPSNYLHDWLCIEACDDDIKKWLQNHRSTEKKKFFTWKKSWFSQLEGLFLTVFEVLLAFCTSYTLWQNPIFCPKIQFYLFDIEFEFWRQNWNYLEGSIFWNKKLYFATVCISSGQWKASCFFSGNF